jgi:hypothetical protein
VYNKKARRFCENPRRRQRAAAVKLYHKTAPGSTKAVFFMTIQKEFYLTCDLEAFEDWFLSEYPGAGIYNRGKPVSTFSFNPGKNYASYDVVYVFESGKHKFTFEYDSQPSPLTIIEEWAGINLLPIRSIAFKTFLDVVCAKFAPAPAPTEREKTKNLVIQLSNEGHKIKHIAEKANLSETEVKRIRDAAGITKHRKNNLS